MYLCCTNNNFINSFARLFHVSDVIPNNPYNNVAHSASSAASFVYPCGHDMAYGKCECLSRNDIKFRSGTSNEWFKRQWTIVIIIASFCATASATATACEWLTKAFANWRHFCEQSIVAEGIEIEFDKKLISHTSGRIPALLLLHLLPCHATSSSFTSSVIRTQYYLIGMKLQVPLHCRCCCWWMVSRKQRYYIGKWWAKNIFHEMVWYGSLVVRTSADKNSIVAS